jgi:hypothetical protein
MRFVYREYEQQNVSLVLNVEGEHDSDSRKEVWTLVPNFQTFFFDSQRLSFDLLTQRSVQFRQEYSHVH